jgi:hypothetical protein
MVFIWYSHGVHMVFTWYSHGIIESYWIILGEKKIWYSHGIHMVFTWCSYGIHMVLLNLIG